MNTLADQNRRNSRRIALAICVLAALLATPLAVPSTALAQSVIDQYHPRPESGGGGQGGPGSSDGAGTGLAADVPGSGIGPAASNAAPGGGSGDLPITGYPLTPLAVALLIFLLAGIAVRTVVEVRARLGGRN